MKKPLILLVFLALLLTGCGQKADTSDNSEKVKEEKKIAKEKPGGLEDVCNYFPKELIEDAIGKPIVKVEEPEFLGSQNCFYYTFYSDDYDHTPYGDKPGGTPVVVVYDDTDFAKDRVSNEKSGSKYSSDASIPMDNYVVRNAAGKIWQTVLILGDDKYIRIHFVHDAVIEEDLVKIAKKFAEKIVAAK